MKSIIHFYQLKLAEPSLRPKRPCSEAGKSAPQNSVVREIDAVGQKTVSLG